MRAAGIVTIVTGAAAMARDGENGGEVVMAVLTALADRAAFAAEEQELNVACDRPVRERG